MMKVVFLGTNGWFDSQEGNTISTLVITDCCNIVLDAGNGIAKLSKYMDEDKPTYLFISHFHIDHVEGLHTLCLNAFPKGLTIVVQEGGTVILNDFLRPPYTGSLGSMRFKTNVIETAAGRADLPFEASFLPLRHSPFTQGIRMDIGGIAIAHCLDTGYCENAVALARNADLLILECTLRQGIMQENHLCPEMCVRIAQESGARMLALTHFEGKSYPNRESREEAGDFVKRRFANTLICYDGTEFTVS
jgi:ribonuclease BN (tRNA processing enzyme)